MAWNESGGGKKNPWDRGGQDGPPDLDKIVREWQQRFNAMLGGGRAAVCGDGGEAAARNSMLAALLVLVLIGWLATGLYRVDAEARSGAAFWRVCATAQPGLRWHVPWPVEVVDKVNITADHALPPTLAHADGRREYRRMSTSWSSISALIP